MSNRAIADAVGVSHPTVIRDKAAIEAEQVVHDVPPDTAEQEVVHDVPPEPSTVTGRDGKTYPKPKLRPRPEPKWEPPKPERKPLELDDDLLAQRPWLKSALELEPKPEPPVKAARKLTPGESVIRFMAQNITPMTEELPERLARAGMENITVEEARLIREKLYEAIRLCELVLEKMGSA